MSKLIEYFDRRAKENRVYILPTVLGMKLFIVNLIILSMGLVYANNYLIMFGFIFFCLFIVSMFYTHFNLYGLKLEDVMAGEGHAYAPISLRLKFLTPNGEEHPALNIKFYSASFTKLGDSFFIRNDGNSSEIKLYLDQRGKYIFERVEVSTLFPLNLFKALIYFDFNFEIIIYPELITNFKSGLSIPFLQGEVDAGIDIRDYRSGDQINRIAWKKSFENNLRTKVDNNQSNDAILFNINPESLLGIEEELKLITAAIKMCVEHDRPFGIKTKHEMIPIDKPSPLHVKKCLKFLAIYES